MQEKAGATVTANLLTGLGIDEFLTRTDGAGTRGLLTDALGSTVALGDGTGTIQTQYTYEPFGYASQTGAANTNSYKYTGREDDGSGLSYYRARYYHPRLQRFISEDPIGDRDGANLYAYVSNNPLSWIDSSGLTKQDKTYGLPSDFWKWYHRQRKRPGDPDIDQDDALDYFDEWNKSGKPDPDGHRSEPEINYCPVPDPTGGSRSMQPVLPKDPAPRVVPRLPPRFILPAPRFIIP